MSRAVTNEALKRAARDLCLPGTRSVRPRAPIVRQHDAPPRESFGPSLGAKPKQQPQPPKRNFSTATLQVASVTKESDVTKAAADETKQPHADVFGVNNCCRGWCRDCPMSSAPAYRPSKWNKSGSPALRSSGGVTTVWPGNHPGAFMQQRCFSTAAPRQACNTVINVVPQQTAYVVERFGKKHQVLTPGLNLLLPWPIDSLAYEFTLKEQVLGITPLQSVTEDNMTITISGMLYMKITDPMKTAYGVENYWDAMNKLAQSTMRTALGNLTLSQVLTSREDLHALIVGEMNKACESWGILVLRYNITQLDVPNSVRESMEQMVKADRTARAQITEAQGKADALKLAAAGRKAAVELESEAERVRLTNEADGRANAVRAEAESQADAIRSVANATAHALEVVATSMTKPGAHDAAIVQLTKQYTEAFSELAKKTNSTIFLPTGQTPTEVVASLTQVAGRIFASTKA